MIAIFWLVTLSLSVQTETHWHLPVTIRVLRDVPVQPYPQDMRREQTGALYTTEPQNPSMTRSAARRDLPPAA
jgi:hypothetical protein